MNSVLLAGITAAVTLAFAAMMLYYGSRYGEDAGWTPRKLRAFVALFTVGGLALAVYAYRVDHRLRVTTLHEEKLPGLPESEGREGAAAPVRETVFVVEHPGVAHELMVAPMRPRPFGDSGFDVDIAVQIVDPQGTVLLDYTDTFAARTDAEGRPDWDSRTDAFTPPRAGRHRLAVTPLTIGTPAIHVRVADPLKRDGERMRGY